MPYDLHELLSSCAKTAALKVIANKSLKIELESIMAGRLAKMKYPNE